MLFVYRHDIAGVDAVFSRRFSSSDRRQAAVRSRGRISRCVDDDEEF